VEPGSAFGSLFSKARLGAGLAFLLLLPLPVVAYTISGWTFTDGANFSLSTSSADNKTLTYNGSSGSGPDAAMATSTVTASAGETLIAHFDLTGLQVRSGNLKIFLTVGSNTVQQTFNPNNPVFDFKGIPLAVGSQPIQVRFEYSSGALWSYTQSTPGNLVFR
jgi:hypothetical protein